MHVAAASAYHNQLQAAVKMEETIVTDRAEFLRSLREAEAQEVAAAEKLQTDAHAAEMALGEATEQSRRAATANAINARAQEEMRVRDAEAKAKQVKAEEAQALAERAKAAFERSQAALAAETEAATSKISEANEAQSELVKAAAAEHATASTLSTLETTMVHNTHGAHAYSGMPFNAMAGVGYPGLAAMGGYGYGRGF